MQLVDTIKPPEIIGIALFCGSNKIEDEVHFLFNSSKYSMIRNKFYNNVKILILNISQLLVNVLINELMDTSNIAILLYNS